MVADKWILILGLPIIIGLAGLAWRRTRALKARIEQVRREQAENPQNPYLALAALFAERQGGKTESPARQGAWPPIPPFSSPPPSKNGGGNGLHHGSRPGTTEEHDV